jgi:hypothetical protein
MDLNVQAFCLVQESYTRGCAYRGNAGFLAKGGQKGGVPRIKSITPERRVEIARKASAARWHKQTHVLSV